MSDGACRLKNRLATDELTNKKNAMKKYKNPRPGKGRLAPPYTRLPHGLVLGCTTAASKILIS